MQAQILVGVYHGIDWGGREGNHLIPCSTRNSWTKSFNLSFKGEVDPDRISKVHPSFRLHMQTYFSGTMNCAWLCFGFLFFFFL